MSYSPKQPTWGCNVHHHTQTKIFMISSASCKISVDTRITRRFCLFCLAKMWTKKELENHARDVLWWVWNKNTYQQNNPIRTRITKEEMIFGWFNREWINLDFQLIKLILIFNYSENSQSIFQKNPSQNCTENFHHKSSPPNFSLITVKPRHAIIRSVGEFSSDFSSIFLFVLTSVSFPFSSNTHRSISFQLSQTGAV